MTLSALPNPKPSLTLADVRNLPPMLTAEQVAELLGVSAWSVYTKQNELPVQPLRIGRSLRWSTTALLRTLGFDLSEVL